MVKPILVSLNGFDAWTARGCKPKGLQGLRRQVHESSKAAVSNREQWGL